MAVESRTTAGAKPIVLKLCVLRGAQVILDRDLAKRLRSLETMSPMPLRILGVVRGDIEAECHAALAEWRKHGEWFEPTTQVFEFLRNHIAIKPSLN